MNRWRNFYLTYLLRRELITYELRFGCLSLQAKKPILERQVLVGKKKKVALIRKANNLQKRNVPKSNSKDSAQSRTFLKRKGEGLLPPMITSVNHKAGGQTLLLSIVFRLADSSGAFFRYYMFTLFVQEIIEGKLGKRSDYHLLIT